MLFELSNSFVGKYRDIVPAWGPLGYIVYKRTYARGNEEWPDTCERVINGTYSILKKHCADNAIAWNEEKAQRSAEDAFDRMFNFKWLPPGRGLANMGTPVVDARGGAVLNNCGFVSTHPKYGTFRSAATWAMDMLMLGVGVGSDMAGSGAHVVYSPRVVPLEVSFDDTREGWVESLDYVLSAFEGNNELAFRFNFDNIRPKGTPLKTMGGVASGPGPLIEMLSNVISIMSNGTYVTSFDETTLNIVKSERFESYAMTSAHIGDVMNVIGKCVVSGGVRRSSEILLGQPDDEIFINLKNDTVKLMEYRWASNNSVIADGIEDFEPFITSIAYRGEPGFFWLENARNFGRMIDPPNYADVDAEGTNPCSEQTLHHKELCTLVETFPANHSNKYDYWRTLKFAYLYAKAVTLVPIHNVETNSVVAKNRRIGTSMSGVQQAITKFSRERFYNWFAGGGYDVIRTWDNIYSEWLRIPTSIKMTSVKPSGTVSLLCGATPGVHFDHAKYYIRRVRIEDTSPLLPSLRAAGYRIEEDAYANNTFVVEIPVASEGFTKSKRDITVMDQYRDLVAMQKYWADNQVSVTITFDQGSEDDLDDIRYILNNGKKHLKSVSFLPTTDEGAYVQMPYEEISEDAYIDAASRITPIEFVGNVRDKDERYCDSDKCVM